MLLILRRTIILSLLFCTHLNIAHSDEIRTITITDKTCYPKTEVCGNGIDEDCNGSDEICLGLDQDADGFSGANDCDDKDPLVHIGVQISCSSSCGDGHKQCLNTGTYSNCICSPLCEATGGGSCYYVDPINGNNNYPGSFEARKKDLSAFSSLGTTSNKISLTPGDKIYIFGGNLKASNSNFSHNSVLSIIGAKGTELNPIVFTNYPGTFPVVEGSSESPSILITNSSWIVIRGLKFIPLGYPINISTSNDIKFEKILIENNPNYYQPNIQITSSNRIKFVGTTILKSFINQSTSDNILSVNSSKITLLNSYIE
jgi:hypothetical protein